jgi:hypothetical protein
MFSLLGIEPGEELVIAIILTQFQARLQLF